MGRANKIIAMGLAGRIEQLLAAGLVTSKDISAKLTAEGYAISPATVSRWLREQRETRRDSAQQIVREHVEKTVPADLDALEEMEAQCLSWARETNDEFAHRLAGRRVADQLENWCDILRSVDSASYETAEEKDEARGKAIKQIMTFCLTWVADDLTLQKAKLSAMRMASIIIDLKLKHAIGGEGGSNIWIGGAEPANGQPPTASPTPNEPRVLSFPVQEDAP